MRLLTLLLALTSCTALAQQPTGTVTGHVFLDDTHLPARIASVILQPVVDLNSPDLTPNSSSHRITTVSQTLLDGSFTIPNVAPGNYYVIAEQPGYLSPIAQLSRQDLNHPTAATAKLMATLLTPVSVAANRTSTAEVYLFKGATISGTVRFDDGSPDTNAGVTLFRKESSGKWDRFNTKLLSTGNTSTDDQGHFRITGLPAGQYLVRTQLELSNLMVDHVFSGSRSTSGSTRYSLEIYLGNVFRRKDATPIKLAQGQDSDGDDIEIPLSRLHAITGSVLVASTGQTVNAAHLAISYTDDGSSLVSTDIDPADNAFHFLYVPEGEYTLKVTNAREVSRTEVPSCPDPASRCMPPTYTEEKTVRTFGNAEQPLILHSDIPNLTITVPLKPALTP